MSSTQDCRDISTLVASEVAAAGYQDYWDEKRMQKQAYDSALPGDAETKTVDSKTCQCDKKPGKPVVGV